MCTASERGSVSCSECRMPNVDEEKKMEGVVLDVAELYLFEFG